MSMLLQGERKGSTKHKEEQLMSLGGDGFVIGNIIST